MQMARLLRLSGKLEKHLVRINILFVLVFLNIWDFLISREILNAMVLGLVMFGPAAILWLLGNIRAVALLTLISIFEFVVMSVFVLEGFELAGSVSFKSLFWAPYLLMAAVNGFWGLKIYSEYRERKKKI